MITQTGCLERQQLLWNAVSDDIEWLLIADPRHVNYLCGFLVNPISFSHGERALLLLERSGGSTLISDNFTFKSGSGPYFVDREQAFGWYDHKNSVINRDHAMLEALREISDQLLGKLGAVEAEWLPLGAYEILAADHEQHSIRREAGEGQNGTLDLGTLIRELRRSKHADEIEMMKLCMKACAAGHARAMEVVKPGVTELEVYREVQSAAIAAAGCAAIVYGDFRACTPDAPKQGGLPTDYQLQQGDFFVLDYTVMIRGYRSDFTNAIAVGGASEEQKELFTLCQNAMAAGEATLKSGAKAADVYAAVKNVFNEAGKGEIFPHHAGHGLGLGHPEAPILVPESTDVLQIGDVITLEPGGYLPGVGGVRIEHNYLITEDGFERLSPHTIACE